MKPPGFEQPLTRAARSILVVEDDDLVAQLVVFILQTNGYSVSLARQAVEAEQIHRAANGRFDLLLTDWLLPDGTGLELATRLTARQPGLPVAFMTGLRDIGDASDRFPAAPFVYKPFLPAELLDAIEQLLD